MTDENARILEILHEIASKVESLHYHYRDDKVASVANETRSLVMEVKTLVQKNKNGNGALTKRVAWLERIAYMAIGGGLVIYELLKR